MRKPDMSLAVRVIAFLGTLAAIALALALWLRQAPAALTAAAAFAALAAGFCTYVLFRIDRGVRRLAAEIRELHRGDKDLTRRMPDMGWCVLNAASRELNRFLDALDGLTGTIAAVSEQSGRRMERVREALGRTVAGMEQVQARTQELVTAMQEMAETVEQVARSTEGARADADEARAAAAEGREVVDRSVGLIRGMAGAIGEAAEAINRLAEHSSRIKGILDVIRDISAQTNLLALNAAIEAARAGDMGRGFAVVADEVRSLAQRTQESTAEIESMISALQEGTEDVVSRMNQIAASSEQAVAHAQQAGAALARIAERIAHTADMNTQIATAAEEQATVAAQIRESVTAVADTCATVAEDSRRTAGEAAIARFTVSEVGMLMSQFQLSHRTEQADDDEDIVHWNDGFLLGVPSMDAQHRRLFELMNAVYRSYRTGDGRLQHHLDELVGFARRHLADEEMLMERAGYEGLERHKAVHERLLADLQRHVERYQAQGDEESLFALLWFLKSWLVDHIYRVDKRYADTLIAAGVG